MKKVLSLLLVCVMLLSFALVANAAGEAYDISYSADDGALIINNLQASAAGRIVLRLKNSYVTVYANEGTAKKPKMVEANADNQENIWWDACYSVAASFFAQDDTYTYIGCDWYDTAPVNTSESEDDYLFWLTVEFADEDALTADSIVADFDFAGPEGFLTSALGFYGCNLPDVQKEVTMPVVITYPNCDKGGQPDPVEWDGFAGDVANFGSKFEYLDADKNLATEYTGKKVVCFGKNASGAELAAESYGITIGKRVYTGKGAVAAGAAFAIVIVDTTGEKITKDAYNYDIWTGSEANVVKAGLAAQMN